MKLLTLIVREFSLAKLQQLATRLDLSASPLKRYTHDVNKPITNFFNVSNFKTSDFKAPSLFDPVSYFLQAQYIYQMDIYIYLETPLPKN